MHRIFQGERYEKRIERRTVQKGEGMTMALTREQIAQRAAQELRDGFYVNLGIGMPTLVANYIPKGVEVVLQSENGLLGIGPYPRRRQRSTPTSSTPARRRSRCSPGSAIFSSAECFAMIRGGHIDLAILGAMQVSENGRSRELDDPRQDGQGHGRRDGSRRAARSASS